MRNGERGMRGGNEGLARDGRTKTRHFFISTNAWPSSLPDNTTLT